MKFEALQAEWSGGEALWQSERGPKLGTGDFCSEDGAAALKQTIEAYWRARGADVQVRVANAGFSPEVRAARYDVRSDLINGLPRRDSA